MRKFGTPPAGAALDLDRRRLPPQPEGAVRWLVGLGFAAIILLLGADGFIGFSRMALVRESVSRLTENQFRNVALIDEVQRVQSSLGSVLYRLAAGKNAEERAELEAGVDRIEESFRALFAGIPAQDPDIELWRTVEKTSIQATLEAERALSKGSVSRNDLNGLMSARERLLSSTSALIRANHARAEETHRRIEEITGKQLREDVLLLTLCLLVASVCAILILRGAEKLQRQITEHSAELARVSWQLLERQENLAQRLSHELHDELGQSLTALKTNFSRFTTPQSVDPKWMDDCTSLLKDSIRSTHEISQLLRPTILDDFGLDSALRWLCERFEDRNRIEVSYESNLDRRIDPATETHLFRIAQEALTNIAKHSQARAVEMRLFRGGGDLTLTVRDDGIGIPTGYEPSTSQFGLIGMRARARSLSGNMTLRPLPGRGAELKVTFPWKASAHEEENASSLSR